jgi:NADP-dependent 3-hydroxy acid dehydrogenase YdfG
MDSPTNISGKVVVITGASSGLGEATARDLANRGAIVVLGARRVDRLNALVDELTKGGGKALALSTDVTDATQVQRLVDAAGAVATELPQSITEPDIAKGIGQFYEKYALPASSFARAVAFAISQPEDVDINEILFRPTKQEL